ncbi:ArsR family transcriptional regulator [Roseospira navarrensis]|uniref:ArsR family transcriptional regulator n=1 Tax=Roseospira navarrensis TaxID=140058 RepID=A0A7X2D3J3_9PROT|nr:ArsR family transcriptional regulator [Roseospira navarrensis]MQX36831.1 ArsR family transcriptional regulator [Roseospira navarrensis]
MTDLATLQREDRRLVILRTLAEDIDYSLNTSILQTVLAGYGHGVARDVVDGDVQWLAEAGLVTVETLTGGRVTVATLTGHGLDVSQGMARHPGVRRPRPGA